MASIISAGTTSGTSLNLSGDTSGVLQLATNGSTTAVTIDTSQRVGIGTASPALPLDINTGGSGSVNINGTGSGPWMRWQLSGTAFAYIGSGAQLGAGSASDFCFNSQNNMTFTSGGNSERMRIDSSGNVGIGTTSSGNKFEVAGSGMFSGAVTTNTTGTHISYQSGNSQIGAWGPDTSTNGTLVFFSARSNGVNGLERMRIDSGGTVFVNTTGLTYGARLQVFEGGSNRAASLQTTANDQALFTRCSNASFSNTNQFVSVDRAATSGYNFMQLVSSGLGDNEFVLRGDGNGYADGTWNNNGADYAEFFESATGQAISVGSTVVLENNKVRLATESDNPADVIGVVRPKEPSKASMVVGNTAWNKWTNKYLTDDFDRYIMEDHDVVEWTDEGGKQHSYESHNIPEDITVPADAIIKTHDDKGIKFQHYKLNPAWDPNAEYVNRENRDEWLIIGLVGQVKVVKGQVMGDRWKKMRDVSSSVEEWFIR